MGLRVILARRRGELKKRHLKQFHQEVADAISNKNPDECTHKITQYGSSQRKGSLHSEFATMHDQIGHKKVCRLSAVVDDESGDACIEITFLTKNTTHSFDVGALLSGVDSEEEKINKLKELMNVR